MIMQITSAVPITAQISARLKITSSGERKTRHGSMTASAEICGASAALSWDNS